MRLYVGNLSKDIIQKDLEEAFAAFGAVASVTIITDRFNGTPKGFAFVDMPNDAEAQKAIDGLHGSQMKGRSMDINEAKPRTDRASNRGGGGFNRSFGGGRSGGGRRHSY